MKEINKEIKSLETVIHAIITSWCDCWVALCVGVSPSSGWFKMMLFDWEHIKRRAHYTCSDFAPLSVNFRVHFKFLYLFVNP